MLEEGHIVHGYGWMTDYYDVDLKRHRHEILSKYSLFSRTEEMLEDEVALENVAAEFGPEVIIHLAAQAGVRYSLENPRSYKLNIVGTFNVLEVARKTESAALADGLNIVGLWGKRLAAIWRKMKS